MNISFYIEWHLKVKRDSLGRKERKGGVVVDEGEKSVPLKCNPILLSLVTTVDGWRGAITMA